MCVTSLENVQMGVTLTTGAARLGYHIEAKFQAEFGLKE